MHLSKQPTNIPKSFKFHKQQYRNGIYIVQQHHTHLKHAIAIKDKFSNSKSNHSKYGMFMSDSGSIIFGEWFDNRLHGEYVFINDHLRAYGKMNNGLLDGYNVICSQISLINPLKSKQITIHGMFRNGKPYGTIVIILQNFIVVYQVMRIQYGEPLQEHILTFENLNKTLEEYFPYASRQQLPNFLQRIIHKLAGTQAISNNIIDRLYQNNNISANPLKYSQFRPTVRNYENECKFYGFVHEYNGLEYGIVLREHQIISIGVHNRGLLQGIGILYKFIPSSIVSMNKPSDNIHKIIHRLPSELTQYSSKNSIMDGVFENGLLCGIGVCFQAQNKHFIVGTFRNRDEVQTIETGINWPFKIIKQYHMEFHMRSLNFKSEFFQQEPIVQAIQQITLIKSSLRKQNRSKRFEIFQDHKKQIISPNKEPKRRFTEYNISPHKMNSPQHDRLSQFLKDKNHNKQEYQNKIQDNFEKGRNNNTSIRKRNWTNTENSQSKSKEKQIILHKMQKNLQQNENLIKSQVSPESEINYLSRNSLYNYNKHIKHQLSPKNLFHKSSPNKHQQVKLTTRRMRADTYSGKNV